MKSISNTSHSFSVANSYGNLALPDGSVQLVVTSPPYPMIEMWDECFDEFDPGIKKNLNEEDGKEAFVRMHALLDRCWAELARVLTDGGFVCINIGDATRNLGGKFQLYSNHSRIILYLEKLGFEILPGIIWRKPTNAPTKFMGSGMLPAGAYVTLEHEHILIARKGGKRNFNAEEKELRSTSAIFWEERNQWFSDKWELLGARQNLQLRSDRKRAGSYPMELPLRLIQMYSSYGDTVLDPFSGTGTTSLAAMVCGRNSISLEADEKLLAASAAVPLKRKTKAELNELIEHRILRHLKYVQSRNELFFTYKNEFLGLPVKTRQELGLRIFLIAGISRQELCIQCSYKSFRKKDIRMIYEELGAGTGQAGMHSDIRLREDPERPD